MKIYIQLLIILGFSLIGEVLSDLLHLPVPGSIIGMVLLFLALQFKLIKLKDVDDVGDFLLNNMTILFLPAGVGILAKWSTIAAFWLQISLIIVISLIVNVAVIGRMTQWIKLKFEGDYLPPELSSQELALAVINQHSRNKDLKGLRK